MPQSYMAAFLPHDFISQALQHPNKTIGGNASRDFHAASMEISSSLT